MPIAYTANVPQATQQQNTTQPIINNNFQAIKELIEINHGAFNDPLYGKHNLVTFPRQAGAPGGFLATEDGIYNLLNGATGKSELYVHKQTQAGTTDIPITASILSTATPVVGSQGWSYLPSGIIMKWDGMVDKTGAATVTFPVAANIPVFTTCLTVYLTVADANVGDIDRAIRLTWVTPTSFDVYVSKRTTTGPAGVFFSYLAIGY